jgi:hypothetical protein
METQTSSRFKCGSVKRAMAVGGGGCVGVDVGQRFGDDAIEFAEEFEEGNEGIETKGEDRSGGETVGTKGQLTEWAVVPVGGREEGEDNFAGGLKHGRQFQGECTMAGAR